MQSYNEGDGVVLKDGNTAVVLYKYTDNKYYIKSDAVSLAEGHGIWRSKYQTVDVDFIVCTIQNKVR